MEKQSNEVNISREQAVAELWRRGSLKWKLHDVQKDMYDSIMNNDDEITVVASSRRLGKCLVKGTEVLTPSGIVEIQDIKPGDIVYGYNYDGTISETKVLNVIDSGEKEVIDIVNNNKVIATSTEEHTWLAYDPRTKKQTEKQLKDFNKTDAISRYFVDIPCGNQHEPHAYVIGSLLGDGCSKEGKLNIIISSEDEKIPKKCASILKSNYWKNKGNNYSWTLTKQPFGRGKFKKTDKPLHCNYYNEWCKNRYAHEKIIDLNVIKKWDRKSILSLLAGLIDTDGTVKVSGNVLTIGFFSQSKSLCEAVQYCIQVLCQYKANIIKENRDKYKNGPCYYLYLRNNLFSKKLLKELSPYLQLDRKKWKKEYKDLLENNTNPNYMGFKKKNKRKEHCYDLSIDNESHMYLLANGLVTHNTFMLCVIAAEICLRNPNQVVKFVCPKQNQIERIIKPIMRVIFEDCPNDLEYDFKTQEKKFFFPHNNSEIQLAGTDKGNAESIRGGYSNWWFIDEAGFCDDLDYVVNSILAPTADTTNGRGILASTPSKEPDHEFIQKFMKPAFEKNKLIKFTIHDNPMLSEKDIQKIIARYPLGEKEPQFRREYLCHVIIDEERAVFPEFTEELESKIIREWKRPPFYDAYTAMDVGFDDLTVVLFAYYDFANGVTVIEDEFVINGPTMTTAKLADEIRKRENYIWTDPITGETNPVYLRISDNDKRLINDLQQLHDLTFVATDKDNKEMAVNNVRLKLAEEQIIINPRCEKLISHMRSATWNKNRKEFDRNYADKSHYDAADACVYLMRGVQTFKNPYPPGWSLEINQDTFLPPSYKQKQKELEGFSQLFLPKSSIKRKKK